MASPERTSGRWRLAALAGLALLGPLLLAAAHVVWVPGRGLLAWRPEVVSGDEPHYLLLINSVLEDHDLDLGADYAAVAAGAPRAGRALAGVALDHHSWVRDDARGERALWSELYDWRRRQRCPAEAPACAPYRKLDERLPEASPTRRERPAHPPLFALIWAALLTPLGAGLTEREPLAVLLNTLTCWALLPLVWRLGRAAGLGPAGALAACALTLASPLTPYARGLFSEPLAAVAVTLAAERWLRGAPVAAGVVGAVAVWLKPPWLLLVGAAPVTALILQPRALDMVSGSLRRAGSGGAGADRGAWRAASAALAALGLGVLALAAFNLWLAGTPLVSGQLGWRPVERWAALPRTLLDPRHGLLPFAPWAALPAAAAWRSLSARWRARGRPGHAPDHARHHVNASTSEAFRPRLGDLAGGVGALALLLASFASLGETCFGPRLWLPALPLLAVAAVRAAAARPRLRPPLAVAGLWSAGAMVPGLLAWPVAWDQPAWALWTTLLGR